MHEYIGPTLPIIKVANAEEAIRQANDSPFGLAATIFTSDLDRGRTFARQIEAGVVSINDVILHAGMPEVRWGGWKTSGIGARHGAHGIQKYCKEQAILSHRPAPRRDPWTFPYTKRRTAALTAALNIVGHRMTAQPRRAHARRPRRSTPVDRLILLLLLALLAMSAHVHAASAATDCDDAGGLGYVCGFDDPEDLLRIQGSPFVLTSGLGDREYERGGMYVVDTRTRGVREPAIDFSGRPRAPYTACPGPPDQTLFTTHGIDIRGNALGPREVMAIHHGSRESVEVFDLAVGNDGPTLTWKGCVLIPGGHEANSVVGLPDGGLIATVPILGSAELAGAALGQPTGAVYAWSPGAGWRTIDGVDASYPNGVLVSEDGLRLFIASYTGRAVISMPLASDGPSRRQAAVPFGPDNLRWGPSGEILATGQAVSAAEAYLGCVESDVETCAMPFGVSRVDPDTMQATTLLQLPGDERFGFGTAAIVVGDELWVGSARSKRLLRVPVRRLQAPLASEPHDAAVAPALTRRCAKAGRLRAALSGNIDGVGAVRFAVGDRIVRDSRPPFAASFGRRRSKTARLVRATAFSEDGSLLATFRRTVPSC